MREKYRHNYKCVQVVNSVPRCSSSTQDNTALSLSVSDGGVDLPLLESFLGSREPARAVVTAEKRKAPAEMFTLAIPRY